MFTPIITAVIAAASWAFANIDKTLTFIALLLLAPLVYQVLRDMHLDSSHVLEWTWRLLQAGAFAWVGGWTVWQAYKA
jgi:hypothetical protein